VANIRGSLPKPLQAVIWFGADDSATTVRVPIYAAARELPKSFAGKGPQDGVVPPMMKFDIDSAFYVTNLVSNWAYSRWADIYPVVLERIEKYEESYVIQLREMDSKILQLIGVGEKDKAFQAMNEFGVKVRRSKGREERSDDRILLQHNNWEERSDDNMPPSLFKKDL
jgi:dipeptidase